VRLVATDTNQQSCLTLRTRQLVIILILAFDCPIEAINRTLRRCRHPTIIKHPQRINQSFENDSAVTEQRY
jgi:hypothetical protein